MAVLETRLDPGSDAYQANRAANLALLAEFDHLLAEARAGGGERYVARHPGTGQAAGQGAGRGVGIAGWSLASGSVRR